MPSHSEKKSVPLSDLGNLVHKKSSTAASRVSEKGTVVGTCLSCGKQVYNAFYGAHEDPFDHKNYTGTCSGTCERAYEANREKLLDHVIGDKRARQLTA
jgi:hypothetical protein